MRILFLETQPCIRALKYAKGLKNTGDYYIVFAYFNKTLSEFYGEGDEFFDEWIRIDLKHNINFFDDFFLKNEFDLIHSHNAPDILTAEAIAAMERIGKKVPIIHDNHNVISMWGADYHTKYYDADVIAECEKIANTKSDARVHVTRDLADYIIDKYGSMNERDIVFNSFVSADVIPSSNLPKLSDKDKMIHFVYEGTLANVGTGHHYDLANIFKSIANLKINVHIYTNKNPIGYKKLARENRYIHYYGHLEPKALMLELTQYDFGWAGFNSEKNKAHLDVVLANKVMEYIGAGLPVISFTHKTQEQFLNDTGLGIVINSIDEIKDLSLNDPEIKNLISRVQENRFNFTVEKNIYQLVDFYSCVTGSLIAA